MTSRPKERLLHPVTTLAWGACVGLLGGALLLSGDRTFGAFVLFIAILSVPLAISNGLIRRRLRGDLKSLVDHPFFRFDGLIWGVAAAGFLGLGLWSRAHDTGASLAILAFSLAGFFALIAVLDFVIHARVRRARRRGET